MKHTSNRRKAAAAAVLVACMALCLCGADCIPDFSFSFPFPFIAVEDAGEYREKAVLDERLAGRWQAIGDDGEPEDGGMSFLFVRKDGTYDCVVEGDDQEEDGELAAGVKTLAAGRHTFLMFKEAFGLAEEEDDLPENCCFLWRYSIEKDVLTFYVLNEDVLEKASQEKEWEKVFRKQRKDAEDEAAASDVWISRLDEKSIAFLKWLADDPENWEVGEPLGRVKEPKK